MTSGERAEKDIMVMSTYLDDNNTRTKHRVMSVQKTSTPEGLPEGNWFRYVIGTGDSRIEGLRAGTLNDVTDHAETVAEGLNSRDGKGYYTIPVSRRKR